MQLDLARQLEQVNKEMDEMLMVDLQVWSVVTVLFFLMSYQSFFNLFYQQFLPAFINWYKYIEYNICWIIKQYYSSWVPVFSRLYYCSIVLSNTIQFNNMVLIPVTSLPRSLFFWLFNKTTYPNLKLISLIVFDISIMRNIFFFVFCFLLLSGGRKEVHCHLSWE